jgi:hypothetical protein
MILGFSVGCANVISDAAIENNPNEVEMNFVLFII